MKVKFYGVRGSTPVCGKEYLEYGGDTTCISIYRETVNRIVIFDAGTGIRKLGKDLVANRIDQKIINIVFSHFHWDHIQGFPFFAPAYNKNQRIGIHVMGEERKVKNLEEIFSLQMQREYFPVELNEMGAQFEFLHLGDKATVFGATGYAIPQHHKYPGGSYGFRLEDESGVLVICSDLEHIDGIDQNIVEFARGADLLIHDGQYTSTEYKKRKGWGHSTWEQAIEVAIQANVKKLVITHHDPDHDDNFIDSLEKEAKSGYAHCQFAKEGMEIPV